MEKSSFRLVFGDSSLIKVLDFLIEAREFDYTQTEIAENAEINWATLQKIWPLIEKNKIVLHTRNIGRGRLYKLNISNPLVKKLIELDKFITNYFVNNDIKEQEKITIKIPS